MMTRARHGLSSLMGGDTDRPERPSACRTRRFNHVYGLENHHHTNWIELFSFSFHRLALQVGKVLFARYHCFCALLFLLY